MAAKKRPSSPGDDKPGRPVGMNKRYNGEFVEYPGGKKRRLGQATSPWQKLIEDRRVELDKSLRVVADATGGAISFNGLWQWLRATSGYPNPRNYTAAKNAALARALDLEPDTLAQAYEASKLAHGLRSTRTTTRDTTKLELLRRLIQQGGATWTRKDLIDLIDGLLS
jgi:hypothetical protein